ncbi:MAG: oligosaccharide flippase family protein [Candidatus Ventricola sp.]|nr:oligosaccharide flippase family protein [Candidatus Ventricola sp.]
MNARTLVRQTMFLSASHFVVRVIGFFNRIWLSRALGAQAMGLVELTHSAQMLLITPVVSGLPAAVSRMCAKSQPARQVRVLRCGISLALLTGVPVAVLAFAFRTQLALWLGDLRTLPALLIYLPCIPVLGVSCALNGYYYGKGKPVPPALSELLEQLVRLFLCIRLVFALRGWPTMLRAAIPAAASLLGETASLVLMLLIAARAILFAPGEGSRRAVYREMLSLALPLTGMKLVSSLMRTVQSALIPARLQISGLPASEALSRFGMLSGMLMPVLMLPSFITCSLCMVAAPELTRRQANGTPQRSLVRRILGGTLLVGLCAMVGVWLFAPLIADTLYRQAELLPLLRRCCVLVPVMALSQVVSGLMNGLGLQGTSLRIALFANLLSVLLMYALAAQPTLQLWGAVIAMAAAQAVTLALSLRALYAAVR